MDSVSRYRRRKKEAWDTRAVVFVFVTMIFACFVDSEGLAYIIAMTGAFINIAPAGICEIFAVRWS
ncbi:MAG: hypothetical protein MR671_00120 [Clostridiales bacterium]|nr:hypothetical protein [Clostridiales bacterium]